MNRRPVLIVLLTLAVAAVSLWNLVSFRLDHLLRPSWPEITLGAWYAALAVVLLAAAVAFWSKRWSMLLPALSVVFAAGFLPSIADGTGGRDAASGQPEAPVAQQAHDVQQSAPPPAAVEPVSAPPTGLAGLAQEIEARREARDPWNAEEAYAFLELVAADDTETGDVTPEPAALVREALAAEVLNPDALTTAAPVADSPAVSLTVLWYDNKIRPGAPDAVPRRAWEVLLALVAGGADIASDAAGDLRADLSKSVIDNGGPFIGLAWGEIPPPDPAVAETEEPAAADSGAE
jgi:hypothetical protein